MFAETQPLIDSSARIDGPTRDSVSGILRFDVECRFQGGKNPVRVLLPDHSKADKPSRVLYVLPVFPGVGGPWGDGLQIVRELDVHNRHNLICVSPAFDTMPFYGAHATNPRIRHEDFVLKVLVPFIESRFVTPRTAAARLLIGFSKAGWGSFLLILRNPDFFGYACSWDAPLMLTERAFGIWETDEHFGTREAMSEYIPSKWARANVHRFRGDPRLVLMGRSVYGVRWLPDPQTRGFHKVLSGLGVKHHYDNRVTAPHTWNVRWMEPAVEALIRTAERNGGV